MKRSFALVLSVFALVLTPLGLLAQEGPERSLDQQINSMLEPIAFWSSKIIFFEIPLGGGLGVPIVLVLLAGTAVFLTVYFKFINVRAFRLAIRTVQGKLTDQDAPGEITHFQALTAALSATVGLGNIAGVAIAISFGGPGAVFWMVMMGLCGMTSKFCECTLGVKYRVIDAQGRVSGGAMYYLSRGLAEIGLGGFGKVLAVLFAIFCIGGAIGAGNMFQVNQAYSQFSEVTGLLKDQAWLFGLIVSFVIGAVIIGGIVGIARVTSKLVPFMCGMYVIAALVIVFSNLGEVPAALSRIVTEAFTPSAALSGGIVMVLIQGVKRAAFSNEAGVGSAPIAHAAVKTDKPASEGLVPCSSLSLTLSWSAR
jgi:AGCS family alanine or glycine:cation symporter